MEELIRILEELNDDYDYETEEELFSKKKLDSFDIVGLISELKEVYRVEIPASEITAENFDSAERILRFLEKMKERG